MLEKDKKNCLFDAHFHIFDVQKYQSLSDLWSDFQKNGYFYTGMTCAYTKEQWFLQKKLCDSSLIYDNIKLFRGIGIHPWYLDESLIPFIDQLAKDDSLDFIGEIGLDYYTPELKSTRKLQVELFSKQLQMAIKYSKGVVIHSRKAFDDILTFSSELKKIPYVIFHSFDGGVSQAKALITRGINVYFSFGSSILKKSKKALECVKNLPVNRLLTETDAPFQPLKGESFLPVQAIISITKEISELNPLFCNNSPSFLFN